LSDDLTEQIWGELVRVQAVVSPLLGLESSWSGVVELIDDLRRNGVKFFQCDIGINRTLAGMEARWRTLIHEVIHAHSVGVSSAAIGELPGWEEGLVEAYQRAIRPHVLNALGVMIPESVFVAVDAAYAFERYVSDIGQLYRLLGTVEMDAQTFYRMLLRTPLRERPGKVFGMARNLDGEQRATFLMRYSELNSRLRERLMVFGNEPFGA
jgi:hypothetical protein